MGLLRFVYCFILHLIFILSFLAPRTCSFPLLSPFSNAGQNKTQKITKRENIPPIGDKKTTGQNWKEKVNHQKWTEWKKKKKKHFYLEKEKNKQTVAEGKLTNISTSVHAGGNLFSQHGPLALITWCLKSFYFSNLCVTAHSSKLLDHRKLVKHDQDTQKRDVRKRE